MTRARWGKQERLGQWETEEVAQEDEGEAETEEDQAEPNDSCRYGVAALGGAAAVMAATVTELRMDSFVPC